MKRFLPLFAAMLLLSVAASAVTVTGTVKNATTGKPSAGDTVELLALASGMNVQTTTKTDASGTFKFDIDDPNTPHLPRVIHQGVSYFPAGGPIRPGTTTVDVEVYDAASKVDGISTGVDIVRMQADTANLQVMEMIAVKNASKPPRAMNGDKTFGFYLPNGAQIDQVVVQAPGGMPVTTSATPDGKGKYFFSYAIKPGETRFQVAYHLPYTGEANFTQKLSGDVQHLVVMLPKSMKFEAKSGAKFSPMDDKNSTVQVATNVGASSNLSFHVSGTGTLVDEQPGAQQQASAGAMGGGASGGSDAGGGGTMGPDNRPGGGLGAPIDAPDPMLSYRWVILGGLAIALVAGAVFVVNRSDQAAQEKGGVALEDEPAARPATTGRIKPSAAAVGPTPAPAPQRPPVAPAAVPVAPAVAGGANTMLLEGLKEELFQLEIEKQEGRISSEDYEAAKNALNQTLKRALQRKS